MKTLYSTTGMIDSTIHGWQFIPSEINGEMTFNPAEGYYADKGGKLIGPKVNGVEPFQYYILKFKSDCLEDCHWAVTFYDNTGTAIVSDVYSSIYANQNKYNVVVYARDGATAMQPLFQSMKRVRISDLSIEKISSKAVANMCDDLYRTLPVFNYSAPKQRMHLLPKTLDALETGNTWRVVMLGDSIINDIFNSNFQALIKRNFPQANIKWICSVRGSTGCWYYQEPENFKHFVVDLKPDLLIIGGISQRDDIAAVEKVINITKQQLDCEIALTSAPFGVEEKIEQDNEFAHREKLLAEKMDIEFIDIRKEWIKYLQTSKKSIQFFYRDIVHGNDRGKQIAGRILSTYISP